MKPLQVLGKYELLEKLGSGGMAEVYKARLTGVQGFQKMVVVKKILPGYARNLSFIKMLIDEAKLTSILQHPNIVQIFELDSVDNHYYIAMEYVDGRDLLKILARCAENKIAFPTDVACYIAAEVCKGLHYAHNAKDFYGKSIRIIHRDVSPSNIIVSTEGHVKIMDFGVAKARTQDSTGAKHVLRGKLGYMSPEQVRGEEIDHRSDLFSQGIVLFESLTLKRLFLGRTDLETLINIRDAEVEEKFAKYPFIDEDLKRILRRTLARDRDDRFETALDLNASLMEYLYTKGRRMDPARVASFLLEVFGKEELAAGPEAGPAEGAPRAETMTSSTVVGRPKTTPAVHLTALDDYEISEELEPEVRVAASDSSPVESLPEPAEDSLSEEVELEEEHDVRTALTEVSSPLVGQEPTPVSEALRGNEFRLKNTAGYVFGPVDYENFVNLVQTGAVSEEEFVSINGTEWRRVREITAIRALSPAQALRARGISPLYSGTVSVGATVRSMYQLMSRRLSGKLRFARGTSQKEVFFRKGRPKHVSTNLKAELLGPFLMARGAVTEEQLREAIQRAPEFGGRLGDALVSMGFIQPHELYYLLDQQFSEKLIEIFSWRSGTYQFFEGVPSPIEIAPSTANVYRYVLDGVRRHIEIADVEPLLRKYVDAVIVTKENRHLSIDVLPLNSRELRLWGMLQRNLTLGRVLKDCCRNDADQRSLYQVLMVLYQVELIGFQAKRN